MPSTTPPIRTLWRGRVRATNPQTQHAILLQLTLGAFDGWFGDLGVTVSLKSAVARVRKAGDAHMSSARASVTTR